ncbi:MAG: DUF308 domain-containing protein [Anaerolineae bacterium]
MTAEALAAPKPVKWWFPLVQGILSIVVGLLFLMQPVATSKTAVGLLGLYWLILGILDLFSLFRDRTAWGWKLFTGIIGILAGGLIVSNFLGSNAGTMDRLLTTAVLGVTFAIVIGTLGIIYGIVMLIAAFRGAGLGAGILGALTIVFGILILTNPIQTALGLPFVIGIWLLIGGIFLIIAAFRARSA